MKKFVFLTLSIFLGVSSSLFLYKVYETHVDRSPTIRYSIPNYQKCYVDLKNGKYYHLSSINCGFEPNTELKTKMSKYEAIERNFSPCPSCHKTQDVRIKN